jgi:hypothetical protein
VLKETLRLRVAAIGPFAALAIAATGTIAQIASARPEIFRPYFLGFEPVSVAAGISVSGIAALLYVGSCLPPMRGRWAAGVAIAAALGTVFAVPTVLVDWFAGFPAGINVARPWSYGFYPAIGFIAETCFHLVPLAALLVLANAFSAGAAVRRVWILMILVALVEPLFQVRGALAQGTLGMLDAYVVVHVYAFNLTQLALFRRYGFMPMFAMRLAYYLWWHIVWGEMRLAWVV